MGGAQQGRIGNAREGAATAPVIQQRGLTISKSFSSAISTGHEALNETRSRIRRYAPASSPGSVSTLFNCTPACMNIACSSSCSVALATDSLSPSSSAVSPAPPAATALACS